MSQIHGNLLKITENTNQDGQKLTKDLAGYLNLSLLYTTHKYKSQNNSLLVLIWFWVVGEVISSRKLRKSFAQLGVPQGVPWA